MKKFILIIISMLFCMTPVLSQTIRGGISFTVESARQYSFNNVQYKIDMNPYKEHFVDKNHEENKKALIKGKKDYKDRHLTYFSDNAYSVSYKNTPLYGYYYNWQGTLCFVEIDEGNDYPSLSFKYDIRGNLDSVTLLVSKDEHYMFDLDKKLKVHWIGENCYNEQGELIKNRY